MDIRISGGTHRGRRVRLSKGVDLRPTSGRVRGAIFSILGTEVVAGARVLDLYAGSGALGIEALSRGASWVDFVEQNDMLVKQIRANLHDLSLDESGHVYRATVQTSLDIVTGRYDLVFADPPYDMDTWDTLMTDLEARDLINEYGYLVAEHRRDTSMADRYGKLARLAVHRYGDTSVSVFTAGGANG